MLTRIAIGLAVATCVLFGYAFVVEPVWIDITRHEVFAAIPPIKVAHLTDLHIRQLGTLESKVLKILQNESPDMIVITGDIFSGGDETLAARDFVRQLNAPLGVWMVDGNWDHWTVPTAGLRNLATSSGAVLLRNRSMNVHQNLWIIGIDDALAGIPEIEPAFAEVPQNAPCIALFHSPEFFPKIEGKCFLNLAGHTHGGQIRLPGLPPLWLPPGSGKYVSGWYGTDGSKLYVSRGIGTSLIGARLFARPEVAIFTIGGRK